VCRYREDGTIDYLGRVDEQVKVRGFRIELGEIETVLAQAEGIAEAVVVVREQAGEKRLVAYVVGEKAAEPTASEMRKYLAGRLPDYMIPGAFVVLEAMPITANGKVDKKKLPEPTNERPSLTSEFIRPQTPTEQSIAAVWQDLLHLSEVGTEDNFFDLGGNSLLLVQVHARLQKIFGEQLKVVDLFEHPTIGSLAAQLSREEPSRAEAELQAARFEKRMTGKQRQRERLEQRKRVVRVEEDSSG
jgi:aryl carrier-like protein